MRETGAGLTLLPGRPPPAIRSPARCPGAALRVLTGAVMPEGADTVALQEEAAAGGGTVTIPRGLKAGANRRRPARTCAPASPCSRWHPAAARGDRPCCELGLASVPVFAPLRVALLSTGDELIESGGAHLDGSVYDANRPILNACCGRCRSGSPTSGSPRRPGEVGASSPRRRCPPDVLLTSGGASRGDEDHVVRAVQRDGRLDFWQIAMKPGRPLAFGRLGGAVFVGLPGNPVATMVCFLLFARPVLMRLAGSLGARLSACRCPLHSP